jgi:hypothetical protein
VLPLQGGKTIYTIAQVLSNARNAGLARKTRLVLACALCADRSNMNTNGVKMCEICGATCGWEPGKVIMLPTNNDNEAMRRVEAHMKAIVLGAGNGGILMREIMALVGEHDYDDEDADDHFFPAEAKSA